MGGKELLHQNLERGNSIVSRVSNSIKSPPQIGSLPEFEGHPQPVQDWLDKAANRYEKLDSVRFPLTKLKNNFRVLETTSSLYHFISLYHALSILWYFILNSTSDISWHLFLLLKLIVFQNQQVQWQCRLWPQAWHQGTPPGETKSPKTTSRWPKPQLTRLWRTRASAHLCLSNDKRSTNDFWWSQKVSDSCSQHFTTFRNGSLHNTSQHFTTFHSFKIAQIGMMFDVFEALSGVLFAK